MKRYSLALDLKNDENLIRQYEEYHQKVWPEIVESIRSSGVQNMEIYRTGNRLFMIMEVEEDFSFEAKAQADLLNTKVQEWESLMSEFQQRLPHAQSGEKWILMDKIFSL